MEAKDICLKIGKLIHAPHQQIALVPSASYGIRSVVNNLPADSGKYAVPVNDEFPSVYKFLNGPWTNSFTTP